jgi:hypothetical protein
MASTNPQARLSTKLKKRFEKKVDADFWARITESDFVTVTTCSNGQGRQEIY